MRKYTADTPVRPHDAAARSRINQRRRQRLTRQVRRFEALLPDAPVQRGVPLPRLSFRALKPWMRGRLFWSAVLALAVMVAVIAWVHTDEYWFIYREDIHFYGLTYLADDELWPLTELDGWNVFWIDAEAVRQRLLRDPYVADARVQVSPLAAKVSVTITEVRPVAIWSTDQGRLWLLDSGIALTPRAMAPPALLEIVDASAAATAPGAAQGTAIDPAVLASAEGVANRMPGVTQVRFNREVGLNFQLPGKPYWVYWGDGANVEEKLQNLAATEGLLADGSVKGSIIDVRFRRPFVY